MTALPPFQSQSRYMYDTKHKDKVQTRALHLDIYSILLWTLLQTQTHGHVWQLELCAFNPPFVFVICMPRKKKNKNHILVKTVCIFISQCNGFKCGHNLWNSYIYKRVVTLEEHDQLAQHEAEACPGPPSAGPWATANLRHKHRSGPWTMDCWTDDMQILCSRVDK